MGVVSHLTKKGERCIGWTDMREFAIEKDHAEQTLREQSRDSLPCLFIRALQNHKQEVDVMHQYYSKCHVNRRRGKPSCWSKNLLPWLTSVSRERFIDALYFWLQSHLFTIKLEGIYLMLHICLLLISNISLLPSFLWFMIEA